MACSPVNSAAKADALKDVPTFHASIPIGWYLSLVIWPGRDYWTSFLDALTLSGVYQLKPVAGSARGLEACRDSPVPFRVPPTWGIEASWCRLRGGVSQM